jgi:integrase
MAKNLPATRATEATILDRMLAITDKYTADTRVLVRIIQANGIRLFSPEGLQEVQRHLLNDEQTDPRTGRRFRYAPRSANRLLAAAKARMRQVLDSPDISIGQQFQVEKVIGSVKGVKMASGLDPRKVLTAEEVRALIAGCPEGLGLIVRFLASTGCRISEALAIHRTDVTRSRGVCEIAILGKGKKARTVFAQRELVADIVRHFKGKSYLFEHAGQPFSRIYVSQRIGVMAKRTIGRDHVSAHCLRHSYATMQYQAKGRIEELAGYLGHASSATTSAYYVHTRMTPEDAVVVAF